MHDVYPFEAHLSATGVTERIPIHYIADVLTHVHDHPASRVEELLPHRWKSPDPARTV